MSQKTLKRYTAEQLMKTHENVEVGDGYVFAQGEFPVLLVAHLDTVHKHLPKQILDKNGKLSSSNGIGGDDRCGVFMILEIVKTHKCSVLFCEEEEIGGIGATKFTETELAKSLISKFNYIIEFDRKGDKDAVFYNCDNEDFEKFITKDFYKTAWGSFSDISVVAPFLKTAAVNLSCGYYKAHTNGEYVVWKEMLNSIDEATKILDRTTEDDKFEYIECEYNDYWNYSAWGNYDYYSREDKYYIVEYVRIDGQRDYYETYANTKAEAVGKFCMEYYDVPYMNVTDVYSLGYM
jgi:hypothetical protein